MYQEKSEAIIQKLTAPPSPQKIRLKSNIFHTHNIYQNNTLSLCPPKCPSLNVPSPQEDDECSKAHHFKARDVRQNSWAHAIQYTPMIFHSIPSSNILKTTLLAGCFSSHKKDRLNHKWQITFRLYFLLLAREKAGVMAQQETSGTEMEDTLIIAMAAQWKYLVRRQQNACGLAKRDTRSVRKHRGMRKGSTGERCAKTCLWLRAAQQVPDTSERRGESPEGSTAWWPPRRGHNWGWSLDRASTTARTGARATRPPHVWHHVPTYGWRPSMTTVTKALWKHTPRGSSWKADQRFMCHYSTIFYPTHFRICFQYYPPSKRFTDAYPKRHPGLFRVWNLKAHPLSNLHRPLQGASHGQLPASGCFLRHALLT